MASRNYHFKFNTERDKTYIQRLDAQDNMQNYIRRLILSDIAADGLRDILHFEVGCHGVVDQRCGDCPDLVIDEETGAPSCGKGSCPDPALEEKEPDDDAIEFQRRTDLMARYCHGVGDDSDPEYCYSCIWSYHPDNYSDVIKCKFEGLSADEMKKVIKDWGDRIDRMVKDRMVKDPFKEDVISNMLEESENGSE